jgi:NADH-quinone oxidoreductase subunit L
MHAMSGSGDIRIMGGLRKKLPWTHGVFVVCWLAICGVVFSGFFSKDSIIAGALSTEALGEDLAWVGKAAGYVLSLAALGTAFYMSRLYFLVFSGEEPRASDEIKHHIHESPGSMVGPLVVLAIGAALGGFLGAPGGLIDRPSLDLFGDNLKNLDSQLGPMEVPHATEVEIMIGATVLALIGIGVAWRFYGGGYRDWSRKFAAAVPRFVKLVQDKFRIDELYQLIIIRPLKWVAQLIFVVVDRILIDKILVGLWVGIVDLAGRAARGIQMGDGQRYMAVFALGVGVLVYASTQPTVPHSLKVSTRGRAVDVDARRDGRPTSRPQEYTFDFGDGGKPEAHGASPSAHHDYITPGTYTIRVEVTDSRWKTTSSLSEKVEVR